MILRRSLLVVVGLLLILALGVLPTSATAAPAGEHTAAPYDYDTPGAARTAANVGPSVERALAQAFAGGKGITGSIVVADPAGTTTLLSLTSTPSGLGGGLQFADDGARGFGSMSSFRRAYGSAGPGNQWHHVVEQTPGNVGRFGSQSIHNTSNIVRLETGVHRQISGYYSSIQPFTGGQTVRQWLSTQPLEAQRQFGLEVLQRFGAAG